MSIVDLMELLKSYSGIVVICLLVLFALLWTIKEVVYSSINKYFSNSSLDYTNALTRKRLAYEILLKKEFEYYEKVSEYISGVIVQCQDVKLNYEYELTKAEEEFEGTFRDSAFKYYMKIVKEIPNTKKDNIVFQNYSEKTVWKLHGEIIIYIQNSVQEITNVLLKRKYSKKDFEIISEFVENILKMCSLIMLNIQNRQKKLSE